MHPLLFKILILIPILALLGILVFSKINENFATTTTEPPTKPISTQLTTQIAGKLGVSLRRISNLTYNGDLAERKLAVSFAILEPNLIETGNGEPNSRSAAANANNLFTTNQFTVEINNDSIMLSKINPTGNDKPVMNPADFFNNKGLLDSAKYARQVYNVVPTDDAATRFFVLKPDANFNLAPVMPA